MDAVLMESSTWRTVNQSSAMVAKPERTYMHRSKFKSKDDKKQMLKDELEIPENNKC
jgi:hypothetical protein